MAYRGPISYRDPLYAQLAREQEAAKGLPSGILDAIRMQGERSNANQISSAGAQSPYQFTGPTRRGMVRNYSVDPWADANSSTEAAALLLKEGHGRTQSWDKAIAGYHGGIKAENGVRGPINRAYTKRVGSFDQGNIDMSRPYYPEDSQYNGPDIADSFDPRYMNPLAPEGLKTTVPTPGPGPSTPVAAASHAAAQKRGGGKGILNAISNVLMPAPDTLWGQALNGEGGLWNARANLENYKTKAADDSIKTQMAQAKLKSLITKGEYQTIGNNVFHIPADGSPAEMITPPRTITERETLLERWTRMGDNDPAKGLIETMLTGGNSSTALRSKESIAKTRAGATVGAAKIRGTGKSSGPKGPPTGFVLDN